MLAVNYIELMRLYARLGIADWKKAPYELRRRASECLGTAIAENETEADVTIQTRVTMQTLQDENRASRLRFIPMPKRPKGGIDRCFFLPLREIRPGGEESVGFELFALVARLDCLAFRFEPAHKPPSVHNYGHVQLSRTMVRKTIEVKGIPAWLPVRQPAFPILTSEPLRVFLCMVTAVHGYDGGCTAILQDMFPGRPAELRLYLDELQKFLV
jgi:hypothetical protein